MIVLACDIRGPLFLNKFKGTPESENGPDFCQVKTSVSVVEGLKVVAVGGKDLTVFERR